MSITLEELRRPELVGLVGQHSGIDLRFGQAAMSDSLEIVPVEELREVVSSEGPRNDNEDDPGFSSND